MSVLSKPYFHDEAAAFEHLESVLWSDGAICPHCGAMGHATKLQGEAHRRGVWKCNERECRKQFTVKVGTVFEHGRMPLSFMLQAVYLICSSKKGISAHQVHRTLGITYKSAWFLLHRIREAMKDGTFPGKLGGDDVVVEVDETFIGGKATNRKSRNVKKKTPVVALVQRGAMVRSFPVKRVNSRTLGALLRKQVSKNPT